MTLRTARLKLCVDGACLADERLLDRVGVALAFMVMFLTGFLIGGTLL